MPTRKRYVILSLLYVFATYAVLLLGPDVAAQLAREDGLFESRLKGLDEAVRLAAGSDGDDEARLRDLAGLRAPVDHFFDDVLVMAEDERVRGNRLALLRDTLSLFYRIADIQKLGGSS